MTTLRLHTRDSVRKAADEFDELGRDRFLEKYGYRKARNYFLRLDGKSYDSKAIAGVAYGYENPEGGPLNWKEFSGGEKTVRRVLQKLGFSVVKGAFESEDPYALVLVENEVTAGGEYDFWKDETGFRYQYPNAYRNKVRPGCPFVYYRGVRRSGGKRGKAEYFGTGIIGDVWIDTDQPERVPAAQRRWFCSIEDYESFKEPIPSKSESGYYELIKETMGWRTGVRKISISVFNRILNAADAASIRSVETESTVQDLDNIEVEDPNNLIAKRVVGKNSGKGRPGRPGSKRTKEIGDWGEEAVYNWLAKTLKPNEADTLDWLAMRGETPGWDISYVSESGRQIAVEVKSTTAAKFSVIEITANEWKAAKIKGPDYRLAIVARAVSPHTKIGFIENIAESADSGTFIIEPSGYRLYF